MKPADFNELCALIRVDFRARVRQESDCTGKHKFGSYDAALKTMRRDLFKVARPYHCRCCGGYHIGNIVGMRQKRLFLNERRGACESQ